MHTHRFCTQYVHAYADDASIYFSLSNIAVGSCWWVSQHCVPLIVLFFIPIYSVINLILMTIIICKAKCSVFVCVCVDPEGLQGEESSQTWCILLSVYLWIDLAIFIYVALLSASPSPLDVICCVCSLEKTKHKKRKNENAITINYNKTF